jgi:hypothetical protein
MMKKNVGAIDRGGDFSGKIDSLDSDSGGPGNNMVSHRLNATLPGLFAFRIKYQKGQREIGIADD